MRSSVFFSFLSLVQLLVLPACDTTAVINGINQFTITPTLTSLSQNNIFSPTPPLANVRTPISTSQSTPDPTRFFLPTPGAQPVTAWRPPLYPVPWALSPYEHFYFTRPISVDQKNWPNPDYRYGGIFFKPDAVHTGIDIPARLGTPVQATGPGEVVWAGWGLYSGDPENKNDPYGLAVVILHDFGYQNKPIYTVYAHLGQVDVIPRQWLKTGDIIGKVGETGFTTGAHLHFEVRLGENTFYNVRNPELWLAQPQGWGVLAARITDSYNKEISDLDVSLIADDTDLEWVLRTYPSLGVWGDEYYQENLVMSDLPAGYYTVSFQYLQINREINVQIIPGQITFFTFRGSIGFGTTPPATDKTDFYFTPIP